MSTASRHRFTIFRAGVLAAVTALCVLDTGTRAAGPKFYDDDPVWAERDTQDASNVKPWTIDLVVDLTLNLFGKPGDPAEGVRAKNVNSIDEVPDSSWFTNRIGLKPVTVDEIARGPNTTSGPAAGMWTIVSSKSDGVTPGFTIRDSAGQIWFLKFDPPGYRGMATGTEVAVTKLIWVLGYHVPENYIAYLNPSQLVVGDGAQFGRPGGGERTMRLSDISALLTRADREPDGTYRVIASRGLPGSSLGGFRFYDTRPDDPNDTVSHEHHRELRGFGVFAAWLNHVDAKAGNSLDTLITAGGRASVRHHLIDFGSTLGSGAVAPRERWEGYEYLVEPTEAAKGMASFGLRIRRWGRQAYYEAPAVGRLPRDNTRFDPERWKPRVPNAAFIRARADDKFWAARRLAALSDGLIAAAVRTAELNDDESEAFLVKVLVERRNAIVRTYLPAVNPIVDPTLEGDGVLTFKNAAVDAGVAGPPQAYRAVWSSFDNAGDTARAIGESSSATTRLMPPAGLQNAPNTFVKVEVSATGAPNESWQKPVHVYFRRDGSGWRLVGFERMPD